jgi:hypothetical protein
VFALRFVRRKFHGRLLFLQLIFILFVVLAAHKSFAFELSREFFHGQASTVGRSLGRACVAFDSADMALPCNPAFIANETVRSYRGFFYAGNNVNYLDEASKLLSGDADEQTLQQLFNQTRSSSLEANFEGAYRQETFGLAITPYRFTYSAFIRNSSLPVVTVFAVKEQTLRAQWGGFLDEEVSWGVQTRFVNRDFVGTTFSITDVLVEGGSKLLDAKKQNVLYVEPAISKEWLSYKWKPRFSLGVSQLGLYSKQYDEYPTSPEFYFATSIRPQTVYGVWQIGLSANLHSQIRGIADAVRFASAYEFGIANFMASFGQSDYALGFLAHSGSLQVGLNYDTKKIENWIGQTEWVRTIAVQAGFRL